MLPGALQAAGAAAALGVVVLLILLAGRAAKLLPALKRPESKAIRLRDTLALDARRRLHLVEVDGRQALVLTGGGQDVLLPWDSGSTVPGRGPP
jgi:flagellar protein FliO/FliZ